MLTVAGIAQAQTPTPVELVYTADDSVGSRLVYSIKEELLSSKSLKQSSTGTRFQIRLVTLDGDARSNGGGNLTIYSAVFTLRVESDAGTTTLYLNNLVGNCGSNRVKGCAEGIIADLSKTIDAFAK